MVGKLTSVLVLLVALSGLPVQAAEPAQQEARLPLEALRTFTEVFQRIKEAYVEEVDDETLLENAIRGMLGGLDPHSSYMDPKAFKALQVHTRGEFGGLGIEVSMESGFIRVIAPIDDTPAQRAGIQAGDMIIKLDDEAVQGMTLEEAVNRMRGKPGTDIVLTIMREGNPKPKEIRVTRDVIRVASVRSRLLDGHYAYLRISQFQLATGKDLVREMEKLADKAELRGYILDLRNNPGGVLQAAVEVSDAFLSEGMIVYTEGRTPQSRLSFSADDDDPSGGLPLVVLINGGSASASEIVAGALQDHGRAVVMGTPSFGKGSVQTVLPLTNERAIKLTTARYFTPSGRSIQAEGIVPDIEVAPAKVMPVEEQKRVKEAELKGHLENGDKPRKSGEGNGRSKDELKLLAQDYPLNEALNLLKGLSILGRQGR